MIIHVFGSQLDNLPELIETNNLGIKALEAYAMMTKEIDVFNDDVAERLIYEFDQNYPKVRANHWNFESDGKWDGELYHI